MSVLRTQSEYGGELIALQDAVRGVFEASGKEAAEAELKRLKSVYKNRHPNQSWINNYRKVKNSGDIIFPADLSVPGTPEVLDIPEIDLHLPALPSRKWSSRQKFIDLFQQNRLVFLDGRPYEEKKLLEARDNISSILPFYSRQGTEDLKRLGCTGLFDTPKPQKMIEYLVKSVIGDRDELHVLDFFGGSGTTLCAAADVEKRYEGLKVACDVVQIEEEMNEKSMPFRKAKEFGIEPNIADAMIYRLKLFGEKVLGDGEWFRKVVL